MPATPAISIADVSGRTVKTLAAKVTAGRLAVEWNGMNENGEKAVPGVYFVRIRLGNELMVSKFAVTR